VAAGWASTCTEVLKEVDVGVFEAEETASCFTTRGARGFLRSRGGAEPGSLLRGKELAKRTCFGSKVDAHAAHRDNSMHLVHII
jgi:hypothetical protein